MAWQNPKTDWSTEDGVLNTDFNRIEGNLLYLYENRALQAKGLISYYVSTSGKDTNDGLTQNTPLATLQKAIDLLPKDLGGFDVTINIAAGSYAGFIASGFTSGALILAGASNASISFTSDVRFTKCQSVIFRGMSSVSITGLFMITNVQSFASEIDVSVNNANGDGILVVQSNAAFLSSAMATAHSARDALYADYNSNVFVESFLAMPGSGTGIHADRGAKVAYSSSSNRATVETFTQRGGRVLSAAQDSVPRY